MSIWEIAEFSIRPDQDDDFAAAVKTSLPIFQEAEGCLALMLEKSVDVDHRYLLRIEWESVEHHTERFTVTNGFRTFVGRVSPLYDTDPRVYDTQSLGIGF